MQAMGVPDVQSALEALALDIKIIEFDGSTATAQQAADHIGCQLGQIVKSLGYMINKDTPALILTSGDQTIDYRKLAALFDVGRKKVRMMTAEQCVAVLGYAPGGVPPIAHRVSGMSLYLDDKLKRFDTLYAAGGAANAVFPIGLSTLLAVTDGSFADVVRS